MLPFGQNFSLGIPQPNLFRPNVIPAIPIPSKFYFIIFKLIFF